MVRTTCRQIQFYRSGAPLIKIADLAYLSGVEGIGNCHFYQRKSGETTQGKHAWSPCINTQVVYAVGLRNNLEVVLCEHSFGRCLKIAGDVLIWRNISVDLKHLERAYEVSVSHQK